MTIYLVCVHGYAIDTTCAIVHETVARLGDRYDMVVIRPTDPVTILPKSGDILIGHPNRYGDCVFRRSFAQEGWARRIVFAPFSHAMPEDGALIDALVCAADLYLATTGQLWWDSIDDSVFSHWRHKMLPFELGVNRELFPPVKSRFSPAGQRRFLYIGNADMMKGGDYLADLADANPDLHFGWIRTGDSRHCLDSSEDRATAGLRERMMRSALHSYPPMEWRSPEGLQIIAGYDVVINCGRSDALPCEILECAAWGLVPVTTPHCGYPASDWMTQIPFGDIPAASDILRQMNQWSDADMRHRQTLGWQQLDRRYHWDRAAAQFELALTCPLPTEPQDADWAQRRDQNRTLLRAIERRWRRSEWTRAVRSGVRRAAERVMHGR